ncbi:MAG: hypothetical protein NUV82_03455 [Candidatus Komeilibacteria bacterium]|nr:hypothetical protein [Candidatus Komeilibacteria bacterium]
MLYRLTISGMSCNACEALINLTVKEIGAEVVSLGQNEGQGVLVLDTPAAEMMEEVINIINGLGKYKITSVKEL